MPDGIVPPVLMPYQDMPFNGDGYLAAECLRLKSAHDLTHAVETGTCLGSTTIWLAKHFGRVLTCEVNEAYLSIARARVSATNVNFRAGSSADLLREQAPMGLYFLDAHWGASSPLLDELDAIASHGTRPCIIIHDFEVPGTDFGYDRLPDGRSLSLHLVKSHLDRIYGAGVWRHRYPTHVEGARRGWISVEPC